MGRGATLSYVTDEKATDDTLLSYEQTRTLLKQAQKGNDNARNYLIEKNLRLVQSVARRFASRADMDDLFQVGCIGLMHAIDKFDLTYDVQFSTYAVPLIMAEMRHHIREDRTVRITRHGLDIAKRAKEAKEKLELELGRSPTPQEIGERIGTAREEIVSALDAAAAPASLHQQLQSDDGESNVTRMDLLVSHTNTPEESIVDGMALHTVLQHLPPNERQIVQWRFIEQKRQVQVAEWLDVSQAHVSRLERRILHKIREYLL